MLEWEYEKDPDGNATFTVEWGDFLDGATIATSTFIAPTGITKTSEGKDDYDAFVKIAAGVDDDDYIFKNDITDSNGDEWTRRILLKVRER